MGNTTSSPASFYMTNIKLNHAPYPCKNCEISMEENVFRKRFPEQKLYEICLIYIDRFWIVYFLPIRRKILMSVQSRNLGKFKYIMFLRTNQNLRKIILISYTNIIANS